LSQNQKTLNSAHAAILKRICTQLASDLHGSCRRGINIRLMMLSTHDFQRWTNALQNLPPKPSDLKAWLDQELRQFFPYTGLFLAHGDMVAGQIKATHWLSVGYEEDYLNKVVSVFELQQRGCLQWWLAHREPFCIDPELPPAYASRYEIDEIKQLGLKNIAAHGVLNVRANAGTYFSFSGVKGKPSPWHLQALKILSPVLNDLFLAYIAAEPMVSHAALIAMTPRQREILRLLVAGLSDKVIANQLHISEKTVRNQLSAVYQHVGVRNRAQLIAFLR
jgi:DNA-binding CsgD family transcriptional regulator